MTEVSAETCYFKTEMFCRFLKILHLNILTIKAWYDRHNLLQNCYSVTTNIILWLCFLFILASFFVWRKQVFFVVQHTKLLLRFIFKKFLNFDPSIFYTFSTKKRLLTFYWTSAWAVLLKNVRLVGSCTPCIAVVHFDFAGLKKTKYTRPVNGKICTRKESIAARRFGLISRLPCPLIINFTFVLWFFKFFSKKKINNTKRSILSYRLTYSMSAGNF